VSDYVDPAFLAPLNLEQLRNLLAKVDSTLAEGRELREKIVRAMDERRDRPIWPETARSPKHR
jgi:hypothetical protein